MKAKGGSRTRNGKRMIYDEMLDVNISVPLSNIDILEKVQDCKFYTYSDLFNLRYVGQLLPRALLLYQPADIGHFTCVFLNREGINYFDPYGRYMDRSDYFTGYDGSDFTQLTHILSQAPFVIWNEHPLQSSDNDSQTCGYWCAVRLFYSDLTNDEFYDVFSRVLDRDEEIVQIYDMIGH